MATLGVDVPGEGKEEHQGIWGNFWQCRNRKGRWGMAVARCGRELDRHQMIT